MNMSNVASQTTWAMQPHSYLGLRILQTERALVPVFPGSEEHFIESASRSLKNLHAAFYLMVRSNS